jgi:hypothetical protein
LYVYTSCEIIGPKVDWSAWGAREDEEVEAEGLDMNYAKKGERIKERSGYGNEIVVPCSGALQET